MLVHKDPAGMEADVDSVLVELPGYDRVDLPAVWSGGYDLAADVASSTDCTFSPVPTSRKNNVGCNCVVVI